MSFFRKRIQEEQNPLLRFMRMGIGGDHIPGATSIPMPEQQLNVGPSPQIVEEMVNPAPKIVHSQTPIAQNKKMQLAQQPKPGYQLDKRGKPIFSDDPIERGRQKAAYNSSLKGKK